MMGIPITDEDFPEIKMKIRGRMTKGRNVYGFFLKEGEYEAMSEHLLSSGHLGSLNWETDRIYLIQSERSDNLDPQFFKQIERGDFIVGSEYTTTKLLRECGMPQRKIKLISWIKGFEK